MKSPNNQENIVLNEVIEINTLLKMPYQMHISKIPQRSGILEHHKLAQ
jgi:hypothetical protein